MPAAVEFKPIGLNGCRKNTIFLHSEEYEVIRLCDHEMKIQQEASIPVGVSRLTLSRIYVSAKQRIVKVLVRGVTIMIKGGAAYADNERFRCGTCGFLFNNINPTLKTCKIECLVCHSDNLNVSNINISKNEIMMKIVIPTGDNVVDNHLGYYKYYTILTIGQNSQILSSETTPSPQGCGYKSNIAGELENMGVSAVLAGNIGQGVLNVLTSYHTRVIGGCSGNLLEVAADYLGGKLIDSEVGCSSHEHHYERHRHSHKE